MAWEAGFKQVEVECDVADLRQNIHNLTSTMGLSNTITHIKKLLTQDWQVQIRHTYRESNMCSDALARLSERTNMEECFQDL